MNPEFLTNLPLIVFLIILVNYMAGAFFITYHLWKFGVDLKTRTLMVVFLAGLAALLFLNFLFFFKIDWVEVIFQYFNTSIFKYLNILD